MPLTFDDRGLLTPGIQDATLQEVEDAFGRFGRTVRRIQLFARLELWSAQLQRTVWAATVILDGSFVMPMVEAPGDIDLILVLPADWDLTADLRPFEYNVVDRRYTRREYNIEVYPVLPGSDEEAAYLRLFARVRREWCQEFHWPEGSQKGIVRLVP